MKNKKLEAKATPLLELINYQADSVVSRTIIDKEAGTVTIFAFDKDQGLSDIRHLTMQLFKFSKAKQKLRFRENQS